MPTAATLSLTPEERAWHEALSPLQAEWLDFVAAHPEALSRAAFDDIERTPLMPETIQAWPLFLHRSRMAPMIDAGWEIFSLLKGVPERVFDADPERLAEFYGTGVPLARAAVKQLADPTCLDHVIGRTDLLKDSRGFLACELNCAGSLGGWLHWEERQVRQRLVSRFLAERGLRVRPVDSMKAMLEHAVGVGLARNLASATGDTQLNLAVLTHEPIPPGFEDRVGGLYREAVERLAPGLTGRLIIGLENQLRADARGRVYHGATPVQLFIDHAMDMIEGPIFRSQAAGLGFAFNGPVSPFLSDKRNLALLSEQIDRGDFYDAAERATIARLFPWTRILTDDFTDRDGERFYLPDYVRAERDGLVIKPSGLFGGKDVIVGRSFTQAEWEARVDTALAAGDWVVQEAVHLEEYLFQSPAGDGAVPHGIVFATFHLGQRYTSCLVRGAPSGKRVVNVKNGGRRIVVLEVEDGAAVSSNDSSETSDPQETHDAP